MQIIWATSLPGTTTSAACTCWPFLEMVVRIDMTTQGVSDEVRRYSILAGFLLVVVFVLPCVGFALLSKYCQKRTRRRRQPTVTSLLQLQHKSSLFMRTIPDETLATKDSSSESTSDSYCGYGPLGQVECSLEKLSDMEKMVSMGACLSCLDTWKVTVPSVVCSRSAVGKLALIRKICALDAKAHIACLRADIATLSRIPPHPFLLNLLGVCNSGGIPQAILMEYPLHGRFHSFLVLKRKSALSGDSQPWPGWTRRDSERKVVAEAVPTKVAELCPLLADRDVRCHPYAQPLNDTFTDTDQLLFALQIAAAMNHLALRNILHKGLSSENLTIGSEFYLKLTGVHTDNSGIHKQPSMRQLKRTPSGRNLFKWDAPEVMEMGQHTEKTEVWRFGMTMWEVSSLGDIPFADTPNRTLSEMVKSGQRPQAPDCCSQQLYQLMMECWDLNPNCRPTFNQIVERVQDMIALKDEGVCESSIGLHRRLSRGKRPFLHSDSTCSSDDIPNGDPLPTPSLPMPPFSGPQSARRARVVLDLEEIPEDCFELETDV